eukprot:1424936-Pyramimonas_sp.AAC.1
MSDNAWAPIVDDDVGLSVIRAFGPDGHAFKWANQYSDSSCLMVSKSASGKKTTTPCAGIDELNSAEARR